MEDVAASSTEVGEALAEAAEAAAGRPIIDPAARAAGDVTACCVSFYEHPLVQRVFGDAFHPGGAALSRRLAERGDVGPDSHVLDVACGPGSTSLLLAHERGCRVTGVDLGGSNLEKARASAERLGVADLVDFVVGDALRLPFDDAAFTHVICECALCTFQDQPAALAEMHRVLAPGGRLLVSDVTLADGHTLPEGLDDLLMTIACVAEARSQRAYVAAATAAGFADVVAEDERPAIVQMVDQLRKAMVGLKLMVRTGRLAVEDLGLDITLEELDRQVKLGRREVQDGHIGYMALVAAKPA